METGRARGLEDGREVVSGRTCVIHGIDDNLVTTCKQGLSSLTHE